MTSWRNPESAKMENIRHGLHLLRLSQKAHGWPCYMPLMYHSAHLRKQCAGVTSLSVQPKR